MSVEHVLLTKILESGDIVPVLDANIRSDFFHNKKCESLWTWAYDYWVQHGQAPNMAVARRQAPTFDFEEGTEEPIDALIDELRQRHLYALTQAGLAEAVEKFDNADSKADEAIISLQKLLASISVDGAASDVERMSDFLEKFVDLITDDGGVMQMGIPTGFPAIDNHLAGLHPEQLSTLIGLPKRGKAQPLWSPVLTPNGWTSIGDLMPGDYVIGADGTPKAVTHTWDWGAMNCYKVQFSDGSSTVTTAEHDWTIRPHNMRERVVTTSDLLNHGTRFSYIPMTSPVDRSSNELLVDPYVLGLLLGDGGFASGGVVFTSADQELIDAVKAQYVCTARGVYGWYLKGALRDVRLLDLEGKRSHEKHIPREYIDGSVSQRFAVLQGLLDTDGGMEGPCLRYTTTSAQLADDVREIVESLGGVCSVNSKIPMLNGAARRVAYRCTIRLPRSLGTPFRLTRKAAAWNNGNAKRPPSRRVVAVQWIGVETVRCITVEGDHYLTDHHIVTHNSTIGLWIASYAALQGYRTGVVSFEMSNMEQKQRIVSLGAGVNLNNIQRGRLTDVEKDRIIEWQVEYSKQQADNPGELVLIHDLGSVMTVGGIAAKQQQLGLDLVVVDGVYMMSDELGEKVGSPQALTNITRGFKRLCQRSKTTLFTTTQASLFRTSKRAGTQLDSVMYTQSFVQDSDVIYGIDKDDLKKPQSRLKILAARNAVGLEVDITVDFSHGVIREDGIVVDNGDLADAYGEDYDDE